MPWWQRDAYLEQLAYDNDGGDEFVNVGDDLGALGVTHRRAGE